MEPRMPCIFNSLAPRLVVSQESTSLPILANSASSSVNQSMPTETMPRPFDCLECWPIQIPIRDCHAYCIPWTRATPTTSLRFDLSADLSLVAIVLKIYKCSCSLIPSATPVLCSTLLVTSSTFKTTSFDQP
jgi:hypothetical protein